MEKRSFNCIYCSSEHIDHPFNDLFNSSQSGWMSKANPKYPIRAVIDLKGDFIFKEMQIVSHESMITTRIDIYISNNPNLNGIEIDSDNFFEYKNQFNWKCIGYFCFSSNERSNWVAREYTKVALQGIKASYIMLSISECYKRVPGNAYKQVSIISLKFIGTHLYRPRFGLNLLEMFNDLVEAKKTAIQEENFALADLINNQIENTKRNQDILNSLFQKKQLALENEEFLVVDSIITQILSILDQKIQPPQVVQHEQHQQNQRQVVQNRAIQNNNIQKTKLIKTQPPTTSNKSNNQANQNVENKDTKSINETNSDLNNKDKNKTPEKTAKNKNEEEEEDDKDEEESKNDIETNNEEEDKKSTENQENKEVKKTNNYKKSSLKSKKDENEEEEEEDNDSDSDEEEDKKKKKKQEMKSVKKANNIKKSSKKDEEEEEENDSEEEEDDEDTNKKQKKKTVQKVNDSKKSTLKSKKDDEEEENDSEEEDDDDEDTNKKQKKKTVQKATNGKKSTKKSKKDDEEEEENDNEEEDEVNKNKKKDNEKKTIKKINDDKSPIKSNTSNKLDDKSDEEDNDTNKKSTNNQNSTSTKSPSSPNGEETSKNTVDPLTDEAIRESERLIELFGEETIAMVYSENWEVKSNGLISLCEKIKKLDNKESQNDAVRSMFPILHAMFSSSLKAIYVQAVEQTISLIDELKESETFSEKEKFLRKMIRQLLNLSISKLSNINHRINEASLNFVKWVSKFDKILMVEIAQYTLKPASQSTPLLDKNKLDLLNTLINENENLLSSKLNIKDVMQFFLKCLESPSKDVRTNAIKLYKNCYSVYGKKVKKYIDDLPKTIKKELNTAVGEIE